MKPPLVLGKQCSTVHERRHVTDFVNSHVFCPDFGWNVIPRNITMAPCVRYTTQRGCFAFERKRLKRSLRWQPAEKVQMENRPNQRLAAGKNRAVADGEITITLRYAKETISRPSVRRM